MSPQPTSSLQIQPRPSGFGASVSGLTLAQPMSEEHRVQLNAALAQHAVLYFPDQPLSIEQLEAFTLQFGEFGVDPFIKPLEKHPHVLELRREADETSVNFGAAWHSDWSFQEEPPAATILISKVTPPVGGDTLFADCCAAFDDLSPVMQDWLCSLNAIHSAARPYGRSGVFANETESRSMKIVTGAEAEKTFTHPVVRTHPVSGRQALYVSPTYTLGIEGLSEAESDHILAFLFAHTTQDKYVYPHKWSQDMVTIWDNRTTLHNAGGGYDGHLRVMHRTTVAGERPVYRADVSRAES